MIRILVLALVSSTTCSEFQDGVYGSSLMYGSKPILRLGPEQSENDEGDTQTDEPKEPEWVSNLRSNIQGAIRDQGFEHAKSDIKQMIDEVNVDADSPSDDVKVPLRSGTGYVPKFLGWEKDLKSYIKDLMGTHGTNNLDDYVRPVVKSIEKAQGVSIRNIDGEITINYVRKNKHMGYPKPNQRQGRPESHFTMGIEY